MKLFLKLRKDQREGSAYDVDLNISNISFFPVPNIGEKFFFFHYAVPMFMIVNERTFEILNYKDEIEYHVTLWGSYHLNIEGQRGEEV